MFTLNFLALSKIAPEHVRKRMCRFFFSCVCFQFHCGIFKTVHTQILFQLPLFFNFFNFVNFFSLLKCFTYFLSLSFSQGEIEFRFAIESKVVTCAGYSYTIKCKDNNKKFGQTTSGAASRKKEEKIPRKATRNKGRQNTISHFT